MSKSLRQNRKSSQMANKLTKLCSISLIMEDMQISIAIIYPNHPKCW